MGVEKERTYKSDHIRDIREALRQHGFSREEETHQEDYYYLVNHRNDEGKRTYCRIRDAESGRTSFDYHEVLSDEKARETEIEIADVDAMQYVLEKLGHDLQCVVRKAREVFVKGPVEVTLDKVETLGGFIEIEVEEDSSLLEEYSELLELDEEDRVLGEGYCDMLIRENEL